MTHAMTAWVIILPFLRPIEELIRNPNISDILVNNGGRVFVERHGLLTEENIVMSERFLTVAIKNIARALGNEIDEQKPLLDARLPDGSRVAAAIPPCSVAGPTLAIRKFQSKHLTLDELIRAGTVAPEAGRILAAAIEERKNILIAGGTGAGKTTLLNAFAKLIAPPERIVVIEDTSEIKIEHANLVRLEARPEQPGLAAVTIRELLRATLRLRPDRVLLGEVRGGEAFELLQLLNTGHEGTLSTIHANSAALAISRFETCVTMSGVPLPHRVVRAGIAEALHLVTFIRRLRREQGGQPAGARVVTQILAIERSDSGDEPLLLRPLYDKEGS